MTRARLAPIERRRTGPNPAAVSALVLACVALGCNGDSTTTTNDDAARWAIGIWHLSEQQHNIPAESVKQLEIFEDGRFAARNTSCDGSIEPPYSDGTWSVGGTDVLLVDAQENGRVRYGNGEYVRVEFQRAGCRGLTLSREPQSGDVDEIGYDLGELCWAPPADCVDGLIDVCDYDALRSCDDGT